MKEKERRGKLEEGGVNGRKKSGKEREEKRREELSCCTSMPRVLVYPCLYLYINLYI